MAEEAGARLTSYLNRQNTVLVCKKIDPTNKKYIRAKELNIPVVNVVWLSDLLLGNTSAALQYESSKYQQYTLQAPLRIDYSIVSHLMNAWKAPINLTQEAHERVKRCHLEPPPVKTKKQRTLPPLENLPDEIVCKIKPDPERVPIIMFTCIDKDNEPKLMKAVEILGGKIAEDNLQMTHLVTTQPDRTLKLMYALCSAKHILNSKWLVDSATSGYFLPEENYELKEINTERFKLDVQTVIKSSIKQTLFKGKIFYITPSVYPAPEHLQRMIEYCGGTVESNLRSVVKIQEQNRLMANSYIVISCPKDSHLITFRKFICHVYTSEFVLQSIMTQTINYGANAIKYP
jgi:PAX-interacting protein 1